MLHNFLLLQPGYTQKGLEALLVLVLISITIVECEHWEDRTAAKSNRSSCPNENPDSARCM